jgi:NAD(P)-dependent dehydrogenase (short-subunit alcohol dehydrogenase family)
MTKQLVGKVAVVAGATRGAGRGIACMLGEAGATVYCTGRSVRGNPSPINRPETIEETAEMVTACGGTGIWAQVDHNALDQVESLFKRIRQEQGRLDILVNNMSGDQHLTKGMLSGKEPVSFWNYPIEKGLATQQNGVHTHLITSYYAAPLMVERRQGLIIEVNDGNHLRYNGCGVYYSLSKASAVLLAYFMSEELKEHNVTVVSLTPGWLRSENMLDGFGVTEENWQDAIEQSPNFAKSETPFYIGRAVVALASAPDVMERTGHALSAGYLAREYGFTDVDGTQPPGYCPEGAFKNGGFVHLEDGYQFKGWGS